MKERFFVYLLAVIFFAGCGGLPPGKGKKAERGFSQTAPIITALQAYYLQNQTYPSSLDILVPEFLNELPEKINEYPLKYCRGFACLDKSETISSYELMFTYAGPGINHCSYRPESKWNCSGYY